MANEGEFSVALKMNKGGKKPSLSFGGVKFDISGTNYSKGSQTIGTSEEALELGDVATPGYGIYKNLDSTNFVEIRGATGAVDCVKILAGKCALFYHSGSAPFAIADTANVEIEYLLLEA